MANWAKLQEQLTGLPVVKRAKHSIHFDKGNGEIVANFSGKPCHYQDTDGLWKPIDTKLLLLPDGFYGSPHSDVKIHKDGRVKAGGYQQKSALVDAKEGVVDGDKIVREFKFGTQYLYMKEDGFRQETVITRPPTTAEAKYLIASESGELPSKYKRSDITAVDADGAVHEFVNLGQFKKWLDSAAYPVTIDPDFAGNVTDCYIGGANKNYATASSTSTVLANTGILNPSQSLAGNTYYVQRSFISFDTSSIGDDDTVTQVNLKMVIKEDGSNTDYDVQIVKYDWSQLASDLSNTTYRETAYDGALAGDADDNIWRNTAGININTQYTSGNLSTAWVNKTGVTYYALRSSGDKDGIAPTGLSYVYLYSQSETTESYRPVLSVTYSSGGALLRVNMNAQMQSLTGGLYG